MKKNDTDEFYLSPDNAEIAEFQHFKAEEYYAHESLEPAKEDFIVEEIGNDSTPSSSGNEKNTDLSEVEKQVKEMNGQLESAQPTATSVSSSTTTTASSVNAAQAGTHVSALTATVASTAASAAIVVAAVVSTSSVISIGIREKEHRYGDNFIVLDMDFDSFAEADKEYGVENRRYCLELTDDRNNVIQVEAKEGEHNYLFPNLQRDTEYTAELKAYSNETNSSSSYYKKTFSTTDYSEPTAVYDEQNSSVLFDYDYKRFDFYASVYISDLFGECSDYYMSVSSDSGYSEKYTLVSDDHFMTTCFTGISGNSITLDVYGNKEGSYISLLRKDVTVDFPEDWEEISPKEELSVNSFTAQEEKDSITIQGTCLENRAMEKYTVTYSFYDVDGTLITTTEEALNFSDDTHTSFTSSSRLPYGVKTYQFAIVSHDKGTESVTYSSEIRAYEANQDDYGATLTAAGLNDTENTDITVSENGLLDMTIHTDFALKDQEKDNYSYNIYLIDTSDGSILRSLDNSQDTEIRFRDIPSGKTMNVRYELIGEFLDGSHLFATVNGEESVTIYQPEVQIGDTLILEDDVLNLNCTADLPDGLTKADLQLSVLSDNPGTEQKTYHFDLLTMSGSVLKLADNEILTGTYHITGVLTYSYGYATDSVLHYDTMDYTVLDVLTVNSLNTEEKTNRVTFAGTCTENRAPDSGYQAEYYFYDAAGTLITSKEETFAFSDDSHTSFTLESLVPYGVKTYQLNITSENNGTKSTVYTSDVLTFGKSQEYGAALTTAGLDDSSAVDIVLSDNPEYADVTVTTSFALNEEADAIYTYNIYLINTDDDSVLQSVLDTTRTEITFPEVPTGKNLTVRYETIGHFLDGNHVYSTITGESTVCIEKPSVTLGSELKVEDGQITLDYSADLPSGTVRADLQLTISSDGTQKQVYTVDALNNPSGTIVLGCLNIANQNVSVLPVLTFNFGSRSDSTVTYDAQEYIFLNTIESLELSTDTDTTLSDGSYSSTLEFSFLSAEGYTIEIADQDDNILYQGELESSVTFGGIMDATTSVTVTVFDENEETYTQKTYPVAITPTVPLSILTLNRTENVNQMSILGTSLRHYGISGDYTIYYHFYDEEGNLIAADSDTPYLNEEQTEFTSECSVPYGVSTYQLEFSYEKDGSPTTIYTSEKFTWSSDQNTYGASFDRVLLTDTTKADIVLTDDSDYMNVTLTTGFALNDASKDMYAYNVYLINTDDDSVVQSVMGSQENKVTFTGISRSQELEVRYEETVRFLGGSHIYDTYDGSSPFQMVLPEAFVDSELLYSGAAYSVCYDAGLPSDVVSATLTVDLYINEIFSDTYTIDVFAVPSGELELTALTSSADTAFISYRLTYSFGYPTDSVITYDDTNLNLIKAQSLTIDTNDDRLCADRSYSSTMEFSFLNATDYTVKITDQDDTALYEGALASSILFGGITSSTTSVTVTVLNSGGGIAATKDYAVSFVSFGSLDYSLDCVNPGDAIVTYNEDGTRNIYLETNFEDRNSANITYSAGLYFDSVYNDDLEIYTYDFAYHQFTSDKYAVMENVDFGSHTYVGLYYEVRIQPDTSQEVYYIFANELPSGGIEGMYMNAYCREVSPDYVLTVDNYGIMENRFVIDGKEYTFDSYSSNDESDYTYTTTESLIGKTITFYYNSYYHDPANFTAEGITLKGNLYAACQVTITSS